MPDTALHELVEDHTSRKKFLRMVGGAGATGALGVLLAACGDDNKSSSTGAAAPVSTTADAKSGGDIDIVNYALTLEYLEAEFYAQVLASGVITDKKVGEIAKKFGETEQQHVDALEAAVKQLGGKPVAKPMTAFEDVLAGGPMKILTTAATVENLGAAAYLAQAPKIQNKDILAAALSIHSVEARHAAALNQLIGAGFKGSGPLSGSLPDGAFGKPMDMDAVLAAAKPFIAS
jgi:rubrerythrin